LNQFPYLRRYRLHMYTCMCEYKPIYILREREKNSIYNVACRPNAK
jgi:hypothetical protein